MKDNKGMKISLKVISRCAVKSAVKSANTACLVYQYQPKTSEKIKKLRKF